MNSADNKENRIKIAVLNIVLCGITLTLATGCGKTGSGNEEARIVFGEAGAFRLGETRGIGYSFPDGQDREVSVRNIPSGWQASVDNDANAISLTCGIDAGISGEYSLDVVAKGSNGTEMSAELVFHNEIVQGSPFFIGNEPVGVVVLEKTANSDGMVICYRQESDDEWTDWNTCIQWIEKLRVQTKLDWEMPGNEDYEIIYTIFNGSTSPNPNITYQNRFNEWFMNITKEPFFEKNSISFWSKTIVSENDDNRYTFVFKSNSSHDWIIPGTPLITTAGSSVNCMAILRF